jgi:hypothetical protein
MHFVDLIVFNKVSLSFLFIFVSVHVIKIVVPSEKVKKFHTFFV